MYKVPNAKKVILFDRYTSYNTSDGLTKGKLRKLKYSIDHPIKEGDAIECIFDPRHQTLEIVYTEPKGEVKISRNTQVELKGVDIEKSSRDLSSPHAPYEEFKKRRLVSKKGVKI